MHFCQDEAAAIAAGLPFIGYCALCARRVFRRVVAIVRRQP